MNLAFDYIDKYSDSITEGAGHTAPEKSYVAGNPGAMYHNNDVEKSCRKPWANGRHDLNARRKSRVSLCQLVNLIEII